MKIRDVELLILEAPGSYEVPRGCDEAYGMKHLGIVKVETDAGITGYADVETQPHVARAIVNAPAAGVSGSPGGAMRRGPFAVERLWNKMYIASVYYGRRGAPIQVISGIDIALWGIIGEATQHPIYKLVGGGYHRRIRAYAGTLFRRTPSATEEASKRYVGWGSRLSTSDGAYSERVETGTWNSVKPPDALWATRSIFLSTQAGTFTVHPKKLSLWCVASKLTSRPS